MDETEWQQTVVIKVPMLPPAETSPNWRGHWAQRYKASTAYGNAVFLYAQQECFTNAHPVFRRARMDLTFVVGTHRRRDHDNWRARFKPGQDALVKAGIVADDNPGCLEMGGITFQVDKRAAPMTVIELKALKSDLTEKIRRMGNGG